jgi:hypothetical protein
MSFSGAGCKHRTHTEAEGWLGILFLAGLLVEGARGEGEEKGEKGRAGEFLPLTVVQPVDTVLLLCFALCCQQRGDHVQADAYVYSGTFCVLAHNLGVQVFTWTV